MEKLSTDQLERVSLEEFKSQEKRKIVVVLDNIRSMHNVGSAFRTSDAFAIEKLYLCGITAQPPHREIHKTALGAEDSVDYEYVESITNCIKELKKQNYQIILIEQTNQSIELQDFQVSPEVKYAYVFGNEAFGISDEILSLADTSLEIPQHGTKHSLNVSVCIGIVLWDHVAKNL